MRIRKYPQGIDLYLGKLGKVSGKLTEPPTGNVLAGSFLQIEFAGANNKNQAVEVKVSL